MTHIALFMEYLKQKIYYSQKLSFKLHYTLGNDYVLLKLFIILVKSEYATFDIIETNKKALIVVSKTLKTLLYLH